METKGFRVSRTASDDADAVPGLATCGHSALGLFLRFSEHFLDIAATHYLNAKHQL